MNRKQIIQFITTNAPFYKFVNFEGHSDEQLTEIKKRIEEKTNPSEGVEAKPKKLVLSR